MRTDTVDIPALAAEFTAAHPAFDSSQQRLALTLFRTLADGKPVAPEELAERAELPLADVTRQLDAWPTVQRDARGRVRTFGGLSLEPTSHLLEVDGRTLYSWCALDALFLPELIGRPARIRSTCPATGETISLSVDEAGAHDIAPNGAVMSVRGGSGFDLEDAIATFCCHIHFFANAEAAHTWTGSRQGTYVVPIADGFEYGRLYNHGRFGDLLDTVNR